MPHCTEYSILRASLQAAQQSAVWPGSESLEQALPSAAASLIAELKRSCSPRNAQELASLMDPSFQHNCHRLEPRGRSLVVSLSQVLSVSELFCWELLQRTEDGAPGASGQQLGNLAITTYYAERRTMLLLILDSVRIASADAESKSRARGPARAFLEALEVAAALATTSHSRSEEDRGRSRGSVLKTLVSVLDGVAGRCTSLSLSTAPGSLGSNLVGQADHSQRELAIQEHCQEELGIICLCVFYRCQILAEMPHSSGIGDLISLLRKWTVHGSSDSSRIIFLSVLTAFAHSVSSDQSAIDVNVTHQLDASKYLDQWVRDAANPHSARMASSTGTGTIAASPYG